MSDDPDEQVRAAAAAAKPFALVQLRWAPGRHQQGADDIEHEHQRRMISLRTDGTIVV